MQPEEAVRRPFHETQKAHPHTGLTAWAGARCLRRQMLQHPAQHPLVDLEHIPVLAAAGKGRQRQLPIEYQHQNGKCKKRNKLCEHIAKTVGKNIGLDVRVQSFHAGAETHIYANKTNKYGVKFKPVLVGVANIESMHSPNERMEIESLKKGYEFIKEIFLEYNK